MTTYKGINGFAVQSVATDPSPLDEGQVWYNNATYAFKVAALGTIAGAWASGGNMNTERSLLGSAGTQTAALAFAGGAPGGNTTATEKYNGTSWTNVTGYPDTFDQIGSLGTQTAAVGAGGYNPVGSGQSATNNYNGTSWTSSGSLPTPSGGQVGCGTQTAGLLISGTKPTGPAPYYLNTSLLYSGSAWTTAAGTLGSGGYGGTGGGSGQTNALITARAGDIYPAANNVETYNGTTWTAGGVTPTNLQFAGASKDESKTAMIVFGGRTPTPNALTASTIQYNGSTWSSLAPLSTARQRMGGVGTQSSALAFGGNTPSLTAATEEWTGPSPAVQAKTITTS
jgi:hypothetical protein